MKLNHNYKNLYNLILDATGTPEAKIGLISEQVYAYTLQEAQKEAEELADRRKWKLISVLEA